MTFGCVGQRDEAVYSSLDAEFDQTLLAFVVDRFIRVEARCEYGVNASQGGRFIVQVCYLR